MNFVQALFLRNQIPDSSSCFGIRFAQKSGKIILSTLLFICWQISGYSDSLTLTNDSTVTLSAVIQDATGTVLGQMDIIAGNSTTWSLNYDYAGYDAQPTNPQPPYIVNWYCMSGQLFGTCMDVAPDSSITAQSCGGDQQCMQDSQNE